MTTGRINQVASPHKHRASEFCSRITRMAVLVVSGMAVVAILAISTTSREPQTLNPKP